MSTLMSLGEEHQSLLDKGLNEHEAHLIMKHRHERITGKPACPECESINTRFLGKRCNHEYVCRNCGHMWCAYYQLMSPEEKKLRENFRNRKQL